jgi:hypothetical protein
MKTSIFTISVILLLNFGTVFAGNDIESPALNASITESLLKTLAPVTPKEASFDEENPGFDKGLDPGSFAPTTPVTAGFDDGILTEMSLRDILHLLAPKTPKEVDFNDSAEGIINVKNFGPVTPREASFEDAK